MSNNDKQQKIILVTGGAGFIGSHLCQRLAQDKNNRVISLDNYFTGSKDNHVDGVEYREGHTKDIAKHIPETPDIVYHLGEYSRVEQSVLEPDVVYDLNTLGTKAVIEFWKNKKYKLIYAGSSTKFSDGGIARYTSPYAKTKAENSELVYTIGEHEKLPYAITYFYNVYGPGERAGIYGTVIEHFKHMYISGTPCAVVAPGTQVRNFTHIDDIVNALILIGEKGHGDKYELGNEQSYSILEVANMFGFSDDVVMFPERSGNRMGSCLDITKANAIGWKSQKTLPDYINEFITTYSRRKKQKRRILVFSTTMYPTTGIAEEAFINLAKIIQSIHFDVVTTRFVRKTDSIESLTSNITLYRIGMGNIIDKFLLPTIGFWKGYKLSSNQKYFFTWSLMASYATIAATFLRRIKKIPLLVTLADQNLDDIPMIYRFFLRNMISNSDQVYGTHNIQETTAIRVAGKALPRNSLGEGDSFANALRYAYADIIRQKQVRK